MNKIKILTLAILLLTACQPLANGSTAPTAAPAAPPTHNGGDPRAPQENAAGAVYELPTPSPLCAIVTADEALNLRTEPREGAPHIAYMTAGERVRVINPNGAWWTVKTSRGETGYANARYLQESKCE